MRCDLNHLLTLAVFARKLTDIAIFFAMLSRFAVTLKNLRHQWGYSQDQLAKASGCTISAISKLEGDRYDARPREELLTRLAAILQVNVSLLICLSGQIPKAYRADLAVLVVDLAESVKLSPGTFLEVLTGDWYDVEIKLSRKRGSKRVVVAVVEN